MTTVFEPRHEVLISDPHCYSSHAASTRLTTGELVVVFNQTVRRSTAHHPPSDPLFRNHLMRSHDDGRTWSVPRVAPGYDWSGVECAGLTPLSDGGLLLHQWRFRWYPLEVGQQAAQTEFVTLPPDLPAYRGRDATAVPWARGLDGAYVHRSSDGGLTWDETVRIDTHPHPGGYGIRGAVRLRSGDLLLPLCDIPNWRVVYVVRSTDGGHTWGPATVVGDVPGKLFEEPSLVVLQDGTLVMMLRESPHDLLHLSISTDDGRTWSAPEETDILGNPPHLLALADGRLMCTYGFRYPPFEIHAILSEDQGRTWRRPPLVIRSGLGSGDSGYPTTVALSDGRFHTVYYGPDPAGVMAIHATTWTLVD
jgi:hypothetical protein